MNSLLTTPQCGTVQSVAFFSPALSEEKRYKIYLPPSYRHTQKRYPVLYLFRGHEDEWFNPYQDHSRGGRAIQHLLDELMVSGRMGEVIVVGAGLTSDDGAVYGLGINFLNPAKAEKHDGIGTGLFEDYVVSDLIPHIDQTYRTLPERRYRGCDGFSLGGYTAVMLAVRHPQLFSSVGSYDGSHMFLDFHDPRCAKGGGQDTLWVRNDAMFAPAFQSPGNRRYDIEYMRSYNPLSLIPELDEADIALLQTIRFYLTTAAFDGYHGNRDRGVHIMTLLHTHGIENQAASLILCNDAHHTWKFADLHMYCTLPQHARSLHARRSSAVRQNSRDFLTHLEVMGLKEATFGNGKVQLKLRVYQRMPLKIEILSLHGEVVKLIQFEMADCGIRKIVWDGENDRGQPVSSGIYFVHITTPSGTIRRQVGFLR